MLGLTVLGLVTIYLVVDFLEKIDNFMDANIPWDRIVEFFLMSLPSVVFYVSPVATLLAVLISLGLLARNSEIVALKAGGVSLFRISSSILLASLALSLVLFILSDTVIPHTMARVNNIWNVEVEQNSKAVSTVHRDVWFRSENGIYNFQSYDTGTAELTGINIYYFGENFSLDKRLEAARGILRNGLWQFDDLMIKKYKPDGDIEVERLAHGVVELPKLPDRFGQTERFAEEMSSHELRQWITLMEAGGYDPLRYLVDLHLKYAFPFICFIMALIGLPLAFWKEKGGGIAVGVAIGIFLAFIYLVMLGFARSLGYAGLLPPFMAAWFPNLLFVVLGLLMFSHVRQ
jgi:lipopolysaccharide export system permease protein